MSCVSHAGKFCLVTVRAAVSRHHNTDTNTNSHIVCLPSGPSAGIQTSRLPRLPSPHIWAKADNMADTRESGRSAGNVWRDTDKQNQNKIKWLSSSLALLRAA